jgi:predicted transcriptional regulator YheO
MNKKERLEVISYLEKRGILKIQKSVQTIARCLGISRYTVYNYLNELRTEKDEKTDSI